MDTEAALVAALPYRILTVLQLFPKPMRLPTACWLMSDQFNVRDNEVRRCLTALKDEGKIAIDNGGWIHVRRY